MTVQAMNYGGITAVNFPFIYEQALASMGVGVYPSINGVFLDTGNPVVFYAVNPQTTKPRFAGDSFLYLDHLDDFKAVASKAQIGSGLTTSDSYTALATSIGLLARDEALAGTILTARASNSAALIFAKMKEDLRASIWPVEDTLANRRRIEDPIVSAMLALNPKSINYQLMRRGLDDLPEFDEALRDKVLVAPVVARELGLSDHPIVSGAMDALRTIEQSLAEGMDLARSEALSLRRSGEHFVEAAVWETIAEGEKALSKFNLKFESSNGKLILVKSGYEGIAETDVQNAIIAGLKSVGGMSELFYAVNTMLRTNNYDGYAGVMELSSSFYLTRPSVGHWGVYPRSNDLAYAFEDTLRQAWAMMKCHPMDEDHSTCEAVRVKLGQARELSQSIPLEPAKRSEFNRLYEMVQMLSGK